MNRATFVEKYYDKYTGKPIMEYLYKGYKYTVYDGGEPLSWQHKINQDEIDHQIEINKKYKKMNCKPIDWDEIWKMILED